MEIQLTGQHDIYQHEESTIMDHDQRQEPREWREARERSSARAEKAGAAVAGSPRPTHLPTPRAKVQPSNPSDPGGRRLDERAKEYQRQNGGSYLDAVKACSRLAAA